MIAPEVVSTLPAVLMVVPVIATAPVVVVISPAAAIVTRLVALAEPVLIRIAPVPLDLMAPFIVIASALVVTTVPADKSTVTL